MIDFHYIELVPSVLIGNISSVDVIDSVETR